MNSTITRIIVDKNIIKLPLNAKPVTILPLFIAESPIPNVSNTTPKIKRVIVMFSIKFSLSFVE